MTHTVCTQKPRGATLSRREIRNLARRLAKSERRDLRAVSQALDRALAGEPIAACDPGPCTCGGAPCWRVHDHCPHDSGEGALCWLGCAACEHDPIACDACRPLTWVAWAIGVAFPSGTPDVPALAAIPWCAEIMARARDGQPPPEWWWCDPPPYEGEPNSTAARERYSAAIAEHLAGEAPAIMRAESIVHEIRNGARTTRRRSSKWVERMMQRFEQ